MPGNGGIERNWDVSGRRPLELKRTASSFSIRVYNLIAMWYVLINDQIAFWTYAKSQKVVNLRRDDRLTCLVETGERYDELRGVQIKGRAIINDDRETVQRIGEAIWVRLTGSLNDTTRQMVEAQAAKRVVVFVKPVEIVSWDHQKLGGGY